MFSLPQNKMISCVCLRIGKYQSYFQGNDVSTLSHLQNAVLRRFNIKISNQQYSYNGKLLTNLYYYELYWENLFLLHDDDDDDDDDDDEESKILNFSLLGNGFDDRISKTVLENRTEAIGKKVEIKITENFTKIIYFKDITRTICDALTLYVDEDCLMRSGLPAALSDIYFVDKKMNILNSKMFLADIWLDYARGDVLVLNVLTKNINRMEQYPTLTMDTKLMKTLNLKMGEKWIKTFLEEISSTVNDKIQVSPATISNVHSRKLLFEYSVENLSKNITKTVVVVLHKNTPLFEDIAEVKIKEVFESQEFVLVMTETKNRQYLGDSILLKTITVLFLTSQIVIDVCKDNLKTVDCIRRYIWRAKDTPTKLFFDKCELRNGKQKLSELKATSEITLNALVEKPRSVILGLIGVRGQKGERLFRNRSVRLLETSSFLDLKEMISDQYDQPVSQLSIEHDKFPDTFKIWDNETFGSNVRISWHGNWQLEQTPRIRRLRDEMRHKKCLLL